jgi:hypothetical protein
MEPSKNHKTEITLHSLKAWFTKLEYPDIQIGRICEGNSRAATAVYRRQYADRRQINSCVSLQRCTAIWGSRMHLCLEHSWPRQMQGTEMEVVHAVHATRRTSTRGARIRTSLSLHWMKDSCIIFKHNSYKATTTIIFIFGSVHASTQACRQLVFCAVYVGLWGNNHVERSRKSALPTSMGNGEIRVTWGSSRQQKWGVRISIRVECHTW